MKQAVSAAPAVSLDRLDADERQLVKLCSEATSATVQAHGSPAAGHSPYSTIRDITFGAQRYGDKVAACSCAALRLFKFSDEVYTVCTEHGLQSIGTLRKELTNGRHHA